MTTGLSLRTALMWHMYPMSWPQVRNFSVTIKLTFGLEIESPVDMFPQVLLFVQ